MIQPTFPGPVFTSEFGEETGLSLVLPIHISDLRYVALLRNQNTARANEVNKY